MQAEIFLPMLPKTDIRPCPHAGAARASSVASFAAAFVVAMALLASDALAAQPPVGLGTADSFAVLAGQTVTNIGPSAINGDLGVAPGTAVAGLLPVVGTIHTADAVALPGAVRPDDRLRRCRRAHARPRWCPRTSAA